MDITQFDSNDPNEVAEHLGWLLSQITGDQAQSSVIKSLHQRLLNAIAVAPGKKYWRLYVDQLNERDRFSIQNYENDQVIDVLVSQANGDAEFMHNLTVNGQATFNSPIVIPSPTADNHATTKYYVDTMSPSTLAAGTGLSKTNNVLSVNSDQPTITSFGTLTGLSCNGSVIILDTTNAVSNDTGALQVSGGISTGYDIFVGGVVNASSAPSSASHLTNKAYVDSLSYLSVGPGLSYTNNVLTISDSLAHVTSLGSLTGLTSNGVVSILDSTPSALTIVGGVSVGTDLSVTGTTNLIGKVTVPTPVTATDAGRKDYIDGLSYLTVGTGLTKTGSTLSINASQTQITSLGTLTGLTSSGMVNITNTTSSALSVSGGVGISGSLTVGTNLSVTGTTTVASITISGSIVPSATGTLNLGSTSNRWNWGYINNIDGISSINNGAGIITSNTTVRFAGEVQSTSANAFRLAYGDYGIFLRSDGGALYLMGTNRYDQYGNWNNIRPYTWEYGGTNNVWIHSTKFDTAGNVTTTGDVTAFSDSRMKTNVETISEACAKIRRMRGVTFTKKNGSEGTGLIAQEIREVLPQVVHENENGMLSIAYGNLAGAFVETFKEILDRLDAIEASLNNNL